MWVDFFRLSNGDGIECVSYDAAPSRDVAVSWDPAVFKHFNVSERQVLRVAVLRNSRW